MKEKAKDHAKPPHARFPRAIGRFLSLCIFFVLLTFTTMLAANLAAKATPPEGGRSAVIVLGCGLNGRQVSLMLKLRLDAAYDYYMENPETILVMSGGQGHDEPVPEALAMKEYLTGLGVPEDVILKEDASVNTRENFIFSKALLDGYFTGQPYTVVYVTSDFHILRSGFYAERAGLLADALASRSVPHLLPQMYLREYLGLLRYYILESWR